ncbi:hypothetical protein GO013_12930 [Pseudodesulfovibrio sp. JC047]|uniref:hypothetical protein n=1 Tax=Pseudodesulfovibrio sp. JC047 TaxID=2683199 RepID=UPI0013D0E9B2|nr:hypothetical protein [Pseudodesulfovibrio sp. JC047]NDV20313.1 hypothetical protein [Pseudodesulfovibrio sp. JC047]
MGLFCAAVGIFMTIMAFRKGQREYVAVYICPECETAYPAAEVPDKRCPRCTVPLEPLTGFYDRHPDLKEG